jgi:hypothetical protein
MIYHETAGEQINQHVISSMSNFFGMAEQPGRKGMQRLMNVLLRLGPVDQYRTSHISSEASL